MTLRQIARWRWPAWALGAVAALVLGLWLATPDPLVVDVPVADHSGGVPFWSSAQVGWLQDEYGRRIATLRRQAGRSLETPHGWQNPQQALDALERPLVAAGWRRSGSVVLEPALPESWFLPADNMRHYYRPQSAEQVYLAAWQRSSEPSITVVMVTRRPTWLDRIVRLGDLPKEGDSD